MEIQSASVYLLSVICSCQMHLRSILSFVVTIKFFTLANDFFLNTAVEIIMKFAKRNLLEILVKKRTVHAKCILIKFSDCRTASRLLYYSRSLFLHF